MHNEHHFAEYILKLISLNKNICIFTQISSFVPKHQINDKLASGEGIVWYIALNMW